jgi:XTP/dITP diphosphohydrolase
MSGSAAPGGTRPRGLVLVAATANAAKHRELAALLGELSAGAVVLLPRPPAVPPVEESGETLEENAFAKASAVAQAAAAPALADDTGLEVAALGGEPGVHAARYAGAGADDAANVALLLERLRGVRDRRARFRTVVCLVVPGEEPLFASGEVSGKIATEPRGTHGFGYDPVFVPDAGDGRTFAQLSAGEKARLSHRARAVSTLLDRLGLAALT